ncbi:MAG: GNAT family N-acetyltransferase [Luteibaculaceae bacterium]
MIQLKHYPGNLLSEKLKLELTNFLFEHLEQYGDPKHQIDACLSYAMDNTKGGDIFLATKHDNTLVGAVITNKTGMDGYIPANILVYIAVDSKERGNGVGDMLVKLTKEKCLGGIALHVEPDNPAKKLYERNGFTNKYLEMRYQP